MTKIFSLFLPQFHADPNNDLWWGQGFTEWDNVKKAKPLFPDHHQPRVPGDGYQMLETPDELDAQFAQAKDGGLDGFVFYHYWSAGTRLLKKPLDLLLENSEIGHGLEFSLCWANHSWTRSWKNRAGAMDVLLEQVYETDREALGAHVDFLVRAMSDSRYTRVDGKPIFFIYRPEDIPNLGEFVELLRTRCQKKLGCDVHISAMITNWQLSYDYLAPLDSATLTQPAAANNAPIDVFKGKENAKALAFNPKYLARVLPKPLKKLAYLVQDRFFNSTVAMSYDATWEKILRQIEVGLGQADHPLHFAGFVDFDNTARYGPRARYYEGFTPEKFADYLMRAYRMVDADRRQSMFLINAWNEWAEGMYLQPDVRFGDARLDAVRRLRQSQ